MSCNDSCCESSDRTQSTPEIFSDILAPLPPSRHTTLLASTMSGPGSGSGSGSMPNTFSFGPDLGFASDPFNNNVNFAGSRQQNNDEPPGLSFNETRTSTSSSTSQRLGNSGPSQSGTSTSSSTSWFKPTDSGFVGDSARKPSSAWGTSFSSSSSYATTSEERFVNGEKVVDDSKKDEEKSETKASYSFKG